MLEKTRQIQQPEPLDFTIFGRSWKSIQKSLDPLIIKLISCKSDEIVFTTSNKQNFFAHTDCSNRTIYRYLKKLEILNILKPKTLPGCKQQTYSVKDHIAITYQLNRPLLKRLGEFSHYRSKAVSNWVENTENKHTPPINSKFKCEIFCLPNTELQKICKKGRYYQIDPITLLDTAYRYRRNDHKTQGFSFMQDVSVRLYTDNERWDKVTSLIKKLQFNYGKMVSFDWLYFIKKNKTVDKELFSLFDEAIKKIIPDVPQYYINVLDENNQKQPIQCKTTMMSYLKYRFTKQRIQVKFFRRAVSEICNSKSFFREDISKKIYKNPGLTLNNMDVHGMVLCVQRLINTGEWVPFGYDPRKNILNSISDIPLLNKGIIKDVTFRILFSSSENISWHYYNIIYDEIIDSFRKSRPSDYEMNMKLSEKQYKELYNRTLELCGPNIGTGVFYIESLIEQRAINNLLKNGYTAFNVYDEIYSTADQHSMYEAMKTAAKDVYHDIQKDPLLQKGFKKPIVEITPIAA
jgi:hypothetical protein